MLSEAGSKTDAPNIPAKSADELPAIRETGTSQTILVIDDDPKAREIIERLLRKGSFDVVTASGGKEGLRLARELHLAAITLDLMMPVKDGFEFLVEMRANENWRDVPVIVVTSKDLTKEDRRRLSGKVGQVVQKASYSG